MAKVVMGIGMSHSPLLLLEGRRWVERGDDDRRNEALNMIDGSRVTYPTLTALVGEKYGDVAVTANFEKQYDMAQRALDRLADDLAEIRPDVAVIFGDDHYELFSPANMPAIAIYHGDKIVTHPYKDVAEGHWRGTVAKGYAMDAVHTYAAAPDLGRDLVASLIAREFDVGSAACVEDPIRMGFGHAFGYVIERIFRGREIPVLPVMLNTYFEPNVPTPKRCYEFGRALKESLEGHPKDLRVVAIGSGGLSHFVVEEELDRGILTALCKGDADALKRVPVPALKSGSSEILCWIAAAGAFSGLTNRWVEYIPARRTPAGTGIGLAFGSWH